MEFEVRQFLKALRRVTKQVELYPQGHPQTQAAITIAEDAAEELTGPAGEVVITLYEDAFYLNRALLPHTSLEYHSLFLQMQERGVESLTLLSPVSGPDVFDLGSFVAGMSDDLPADGTIRLNERALATADLEISNLMKLRSSYSGAVDALRSVASAMSGDGGFELNSVAKAVENLLEYSLTNSGAALLLSTVKSHDEYTFFHSVNTCIMALAMGRLIGLDRIELLPIGVGSLLHDIGKVAVSASVLQHPGRLDPEQWAEVKLHPQEGAQAILAAAGPGHEIAAAIAFEHHSRFDGKGYPAIFGGERPHPFSRLVSVADTYDAVTTRRSYRRAETPNRALNVLLNGAGKAYDPDMVRAFIKMMGVYPPGSLLQLHTGEVVMVTHHEELAGELQGVVVKGRDGRLVSEPEPFPFVPEDIVDQLLPDRAGVDPASLLERVADFVTL